MRFAVVLTGAEDSLPDYTLPVSNVSARLRNGSNSYMQVTCPAVDGLQSALDARPNGDLVLMQTVAYGLSNEVETEIGRVNLGPIRSDRGPKSHTYILTGNKQWTNQEPRSVAVSKISLVSGDDGLYRYRSPLVNRWLRAGDTAVIADDGGRQIVVELVTLTIGPQSATVEIKELAA